MKKTLTYNIVSIIAYLTGVPKRFFHADKSLLLEVYYRLEEDRDAKILRHLCMIRTALEQKYKRISDEALNNNRSLSSLTEYIPEESIKYLFGQGIRLFSIKWAPLWDTIIMLNRSISDRVNNCRKLFPPELEWEYFKNLFIMPDGLTVDGVKAGGKAYYQSRSRMPYGVYINWIPDRAGNLFYSDQTFLGSLYRSNNDDFSWISDTVPDLDQSMEILYSFCRGNKRIIILVDCENVDPYMFCALLNKMGKAKTKPIEKIVLFNDLNTSSAWNIVKNHVTIPVENNVVKRIKTKKSLVDLRLVAYLEKECTLNDDMAFILASSDSDFGVLLMDELISPANLFFLVERDKLSSSMSDALDEKGHSYMYIDSIESGKKKKLQAEAIIDSMNMYSAKGSMLSLFEAFENALLDTKIQMPDDEKYNFILNLPLGENPFVNAAS